MKTKAVALAIALSITSGCGNVSFNIFKEDTYEARVAAAREYFVVDNTNERAEKLIIAWAKTFPVEEQKHVIELLTEGINIEFLKQEQARLMAEHLTLEEIEFMTEYAASPIGKSAKTKMAVMSVKFDPVVVSEVKRVLLAK